MSSLPEIVKKQIDDTINGLSYIEVEDGDLPGFNYDGRLYVNKEGEPIFLTVRNIMDRIDIKLFSKSNLLYFGFSQSKDMQNYFKKKLNDIGIKFHVAYIMNPSEENNLKDLITKYQNTED
jgi:hypothetical protein|tara:strand:- start:633 stop:995 length:363 start_codon:yes stop_codon:yes gene_type:complete